MQNVEGSPMFCRPAGCEIFRPAIPDDADLWAEMRARVIPATTKEATATLSWAHQLWIWRGEHSVLLPTAFGGLAQSIEKGPLHVVATCYQLKMGLR